MPHTNINLGAEVRPPKGNRSHPTSDAPTMNAGKIAPKLPISSGGYEADTAAPVE